MFNWNYSYLAQLSYEDALQYTSNAGYPGQYECDSWSYEGNGIVSEVGCYRKCLFYSDCACSYNQYIIQHMHSVISIIFAQCHCPLYKQ
jgi:hypothetical protein